MAGFDVVGVDIEPQPNYPFEFHQADAMTFSLDGFNVIHASPPCQMYSTNMRHLSGPQPMLIDATRERLQASGATWVIENVEGSPLPDQDDLFGRHGIILCGTAFGLRVWRHRWFESNVPLLSKGCAHAGHAMNPHNVAGRARIYEEFGRQDPEILWRNEMGVGWMGRYDAREAIPPVYTQWIGQQLIETMKAVA